MNLKSLIICTALMAVPLTGCTHQATTTSVPLAPGFSSQADQTMDQVLVGARTFYTDIQAKISLGTYTPAPTEKTALNSFATALTAAQVVYVAFHGGTATLAQAQAAVVNLSAQQTSLQNTLSVGAK